MVVRRQRFRAATILGLTFLVSACGGRTREHSEITDDARGASGAGGSAGMSAGGTGASAATGAAGITGGGDSNHVIVVPGAGGSAGSPALGGTGGTNPPHLGNDGGASDVALDSSCSVPLRLA